MLEKKAEMLTLEYTIQKLNYTKYTAPEVENLIL